jgi:hypothetical protein
MPSAFDNLAPRYMRGLVQDLNLSPEQAAGVVGNLAAESGLLAVQEHSPISGRGGYGVAQWTGPRRDAFEAWARTKGLALDSYEANYGFLVRELLTTHAKSLKQLRLTTTAKAAAETFGYWFERFAGYQNLGNTNYRNRIRLAERALALYRAQQPAPSPAPAPAPQPTPVPPMPSPAPLPLPNTKPWWQSKTVLTNIATLLASMPLFAKYLGGADVSTVTETLSTLAVLAGPIISSLFRRFSDSAIAGSPLARQLDAVQGQRDDASYARAQPVREAWNIDQLPAVIQHVTDHQEVMRLATQLPWTEFAALAIKLLPVLTAAKDAAQKVVEQRPPPPPATSDPLDILRQQP